MLLIHLNFLLLKILSLDLHPHFNWVICLLDIWFLEFFKYFILQPSIRFIGGKSISSFCWLPFCLDIDILCSAKLFQFFRFHLLLIVVLELMMLDQKFSLERISSRIFSTFFSITFAMSCFMLNTLIHLKLCFVQCYTQNNRFEFFNYNRFEFFYLQRYI